MASLLTIPLELLVAISSFLPTEDLGALRLACKQTEKSLYEWFSKEFFSKKQFMLTHKSLQALIDISKHASFSKKLTHVIISTNLYEDIPLRFRDEDSAARYIQGYEDQQALFDTGVDREMLTEAFSRLENLQTVGIRNFDANNRFRDGKSWSSWGATTVYHETGYQLNSVGRGSYSSGQNERFFSRVFSTIIYALGRANRHPPEIEVLLRKYGLFDSAFSIPDFFRPTVEPVLHNLTTLLLNVGLIQGSMHTHSNGTIADPHPGRSLRSFLGHTPNLKHLRLNFDKHRVSHNEAFLHWLSEPVSTAPANATFLNPPSIALAQLQTLELGQLSVQANLIAMLVSKFAPTLQDLSLWRMDLRSITPRPYSHKPNYWKDLFEMLSNIPQLNLNHVKVGMLQQEHMFVNFKEKEDGEPWKQKEHTGKGMGKFLEGLVEQVFVQWPPEIPVSNSDGEDEDGDEDMDDEDEELNTDDEYADDG